MAENPQIEDAIKVNRIVERRRAEAFQSLYASNVQIESTLFDFRLTIADIKEANDERAFLEDRVEIILSPQHAKVLAMVFIQNVKNYEGQFGEIRLPAEMLPQRVKKDPQTE